MNIDGREDTRLDFAASLAGKAARQSAHGARLAARAGASAAHASGRALVAGAREAGRHAGHAAHSLKRTGRRYLAWQRVESAVRAHTHILMAIEAMLLKSRTNPSDELPARLHDAETKNGIKFASCIAKAANGQLSQCCPKSDDPFHYEACGQAAEAVSRAFDALHKTFEGDEEAWEAYVAKHYNPDKVLRRFSRAKITAATVALLAALAALYATNAMSLPSRDAMAATLLQKTGIGSEAVKKLTSTFPSLSITERLSALKAFLKRWMPPLSFTRVKEITNGLAKKAGANGTQLVNSAWDAATQIGLRPWIQAREDRDARHLKHTSKSLSGF